MSFFLSDFNETCIFSAGFARNPHYKSSLKSAQWESSCSMSTDRYDEIKSRFSQFSERV